MIALLGFCDLLRCLCLEGTLGSFFIRGESRRWDPVSQADLGLNYPTESLSQFSGEVHVQGFGACVWVIVINRLCVLPQPTLLRSLLYHHTTTTDQELLILYSDHLILTEEILFHYRVFGKIKTNNAPIFMSTVLGAE